MTGANRVIDRLKRHFKTARVACFSPSFPPTITSDTSPSSKNTFTSSSSLTSDFEHIPEYQDDNHDAEPSNMGGKSNKFDYSKKKNTGVSLGQFIAKQLDSEAEVIKRATERRARKHSTGSTASPDGGESDEPAIHRLDLKVPGKELGDDGFCVLADGLEGALRKEAALVLQDIDLTDNGLTTAALARLASVIELAKFDVQTINTAGNNIVVVSDQQAAQWELFLRSFRDCRKLRRLDLSGNALGVRAMEILAQIHIAEPQVDPVRLTSKMSISTFDTTHSSGESTRKDSLTLDPSADHARNSISDGLTLTRRCGLRALPYFMISNTGLTTTGALWLSYVLEDHYYPHQLTTELNATPATNEAYQQGARMHGIDWSGNEAALTKDGLLLLQKAEGVRGRTVVDDNSTSTDSVTMGESAELLELIGDGKRSIGRRSSRATTGNRRTSLKSINSIDGGEQGVAMLDSLRKRIQRQIIAHDKPSSVHLWHAALKLLRCARLLLIASPVSRKTYTGPAVFKVSINPDVKSTPSEQHSSPARKTSQKHSNKLSVDTKRAGPPIRGSYAKLLSPSGRTHDQPEQALTEVNTPKKIFKAHRKDAFSDAADPVAVTDRLNGLVLRVPQQFARYVDYQQTRIAEHGVEYRDTNVACYLPMPLIDCIIGFALPERELGLMTYEQRSAAVQWGLRRDTLKVGWAGKDLSNQAWMLLDSIKCLEYGQ
ncbi:hypothetical protein LTR22_009631 [Elasticomyces elasticus]|nr:hypothetical protein LTR22_009631 [Elasticomyces elasticus]